MHTAPAALKQLQTDFASAVFSTERSAIAQQVRAQGELSAEQRVGIYRNSVHGILWQYLASLYTVCNELVGEKFFEQLCDDFIDRSPPDTPFLADYGAGFADFMHHHDALNSMRWLADVAELEWARHQAWNAVNQPTSDFAQLATLNEEQQLAVQFRLPASMQLIHSTYAVHQVWLAHQPEDYPDKLALENIQLQQDNHLIVWRIRRELHQVPLSEDQWRFLTAVHQQQSLAELTEVFQEQIGVLLSEAIQQGWIIELCTQPTASTEQSIK